MLSGEKEETGRVRTIEDHAASPSPHVSDGVGTAGAACRMWTSASHNLCKQARQSLRTSVCVLPRTALHNCGKTNFVL